MKLKVTWTHSSGLFTGKFQEGHLSKIYLRKILCTQLVFINFYVTVGTNF